MVAAVMSYRQIEKIEQKPIIDVRYAYRAKLCLKSYLRNP